jgi:hypothetical protein
MGYEQSEQYELLAELHGDNHVYAGLEEIIFNTGLTCKLSESLGFLASAGTTMYSHERGRTYVVYFGIRWTI